MELSISLMSCSQSFAAWYAANYDESDRYVGKGMDSTFFVARGIEDIIFDRVDRNSSIDREVFVVAEQRR